MDIDIFALRRKYRASSGNDGSILSDLHRALDALQSAEARGDEAGKGRDYWESQARYNAECYEKRVNEIIAERDRLQAELEELKDNYDHERANHLQTIGWHAEACVDAADWQERCEAAESRYDALQEAIRSMGTANAICGLCEHWVYAGCHIESECCGDHYVFDEKKWRERKNDT